MKLHSTLFGSLLFKCRGNKKIATINHIHVSHHHRSRVFSVFQTHTFNTVGIHHILVNFTNVYGSVMSNLTVIAVPRDVLSAAVSYPDSHYSIQYYDVMNVVVVVATSLRYFTYIDIDMGDGRTSYSWALVDEAVWNQPTISNR